MIIGIDLGTTNSLAAIWTDGKPEIVPNALGHHLTPSVVGIDDNGDILVGMAARERLLTHPQLTAALFKRYMGSNRTITLGKRAFRSEELSSLVLRSLKADVEAKVGKPVTEAIITVPAYFSDAQRKATKIAGQLAGLSVERLLNEPTAAALAYGLHQTSAESKFLVFDLGGGTFDVSILELFDGVMEVHASAGDNFLGGEDFVDRIIDAFIDAVGKAAGVPPRTQLPASFHQALRDQAERAKRHLSEDDSATLSVQWKGQPITWTVTTEQFATLSAPLLQRLRVPVERALRDARIRAAELNEVILVGGATRKPIIRKMVAQMFGRLPARHINPDEAVALGAAVQAGLKMRDAALNEVVLTDVCPYSLGIEVAEMISPNNFQSGFYLPVIERNTVVPTSRSKNVSTVQNNQRQILVKIFQGESRLVKDNIFLGEISVPVPPKRAGEESIDVRFTYDINGLLEVEVQVTSTGKKQQMIIEENPGVLRPSEIERRLQELAALKIHPRDQAENRTLLARADRLYEQSLGELRAFLAEQINRFQIIIERQDQREISEARAMLSASLDEIEGDSYL